jgi:DNA-binding MarR family transcriptional regulator
MSDDVLDSVIHVPARLRILVTLAKMDDGETLSFARLRQLLELTPGNLITHLRKLEEVDYIRTNKTGSGTASVTTVTMTRSGRAALDAYTAALRDLLARL